MLFLFTVPPKPHISMLPVSTSSVQKPDQCQQVDGNCKIYKQPFHTTLLMDPVQPIPEDGQPLWKAMDVCIYNILEQPIQQGKVLSEAGGSIILPSTNGHPYHWIVMLPNTDYIPPLPTGIQRVQPRTDGRLGPDNQTITPQLYTQNFEYVCCILKQPDDLNHPLQILWMTVRLTDTSMVEGIALDLEMWALKPDFLEKLCCVQDALVMRPAEYETITGRQSNGGNLLAATIDHLFSHLSTMGMTWKELVLAVAEFQQSCLDIKGWFRFMVKYWPCLMGPFCDEEIANDVMGAFTQDVMVLQELHKMRIPCWYIQPSFCLLDHTAIGDHRYIDKLPHTVVINQFADGLGNLDPYPILWEGLPCTEMWEQTQHLGCQMKNLTKPSTIGIREVHSTVGELSLPSLNEWMQLQGDMTLPILPSSPCLSNLPATHQASSTLTGLTEASWADNPTSGPTLSTTTTYLASPMQTTYSTPCYHPYTTSPTYCDRQHVSKRDHTPHPSQGYYA